MAPGDDAQTSIALLEPVGIVKDLDVVAISLGDVDGILVLPVMVILVESNPVCKAPGCLDTLVGVFRRPSGWPLSDCL